jgi:hypothetical protein
LELPAREYSPSSGHQDKFHEGTGDLEKPFLIPVEGGLFPVIFPTIMTTTSQTPFQSLVMVLSLWVVLSVVLHQRLFLFLLAKGVNAMRLDGHRCLAIGR